MVVLTSFLRLNNIVLLLYLLTLIALFHHTDAKGKCEELTVPLCRDLFYNTTFVPNYFNHLNQEDAGLEVHQFFPLIKVECSPYLKQFLCLMYAPPCTPDGAIFTKPCKSLCEFAKKGCAPVMAKFGFKWPFDCNSDMYPRDEEICIRKVDIDAGNE